jgi:hypothetical protein
MRGGVLSFFPAGASGVALDENDYFLYNTTPGALLYDARNPPSILPPSSIDAKHRAECRHA